MISSSSSIHWVQVVKSTKNISRSKMNLNTKVMDDGYNLVSTMGVDHGGTRPP